MVTREGEIRQALHQGPLSRFHNDASSLVLDELGLCRGSARIDIAVINGHLHGYEIKSDRDTLDRLPSQIEVYLRTLDYVTMVVGKAHASSIDEHIPESWGICEVSYNKGALGFTQIREPRLNKQIDSFAVAQLLWRDEALTLLEKLNMDKGVRSKKRMILCKILAEELSYDDLSHNVCTILKSRQDWRVDSAQA